MNNIDLSHMPKPLAEGILQFDVVMEGPADGDHRTITFKPPLKVDYTVWPEDEDVAKKDGIEVDPKKPTLAYFTFDFGMTSRVYLTPEKNMFVHGYEGLSKESTPEEILIKTLTFDLFHAFCHCDMDPNYTPYHWAILGWLKDRAKVVEPD